MHIAILNQDFLPENGAGPARITELASHWIAAGHRVSVLCGFPNRRLAGQQDGRIPAAYRRRLFMRETIQGIEVHRSWLYTSPERGFSRLLLNYLSFAGSSFVNAMTTLGRPDVLIASGPPYFQQFSGAAAAVLKGIPLVVEIRDLWPDYIAEMGLIKHPSLLSLLFASERWLLRRADAVTVVTESFRQRLIAKGVAGSEITVIPNGVDISRYYACDEPSPIAADSRAPTIGYLGTFGAGQGLLAVLGAARVLRARGIAARFVLVGDGSERAALEADLDANPIDTVSLHPPVSRDATRALYNACDIVLVPHAPLPVLADTVPSKIFEVMACERPLVAALRGEGARIVERSGGGVLAQPGDAESIATAIAQVLQSSQEHRRAMGAAGRAFALREYDRRVLAERYLDLLTRVAGHAVSASTIR